jgi:Na+-driven multidrug efflux pump
MAPHARKEVVMLGLALTAVVYFAALGDTATASLIAGCFSVLNTALTALALHWLNRGKREIHSTGIAASAAATAAAAASDSAADAATAAAEACRVAKSIGSAIRHEDPLVVKHQLGHGE